MRKYLLAGATFLVLAGLTLAEVSFVKYDTGKVTEIVPKAGKKQDK